MNKSIYSLVLSDRLIDEIDKIAYLKGSSRSNIINGILAEYLSYSTPEQNMENIFRNLQSHINGSSRFQIINQPSTSMFSVKSILKYKYNPTIKYSVELRKNGGGVVGDLKISFRTQSGSFIELLNSFFRLWSALEDKYISDFFDGGKIPRHTEPGRFVRTLLLPNDKKDRSTERIGQTIGSYILMFDDVMKEFFLSSGDLEKAALNAEKKYIDYLKQGIIIM